MQDVMDVLSVWWKLYYLWDSLERAKYVQSSLHTDINWISKTHKQTRYLEASLKIEDCYHALNEQDPNLLEGSMLRYKYIYETKKKIIL